MKHSVLDWIMILVGYGCLGLLIAMAMLCAVRMFAFVFPGKGKRA